MLNNNNKFLYNSFSTLDYYFDTFDYFFLLIFSITIFGIFLLIKSISIKKKKKYSLIFSFWLILYFFFLCKKYLFFNPLGALEGDSLIFCLNFDLLPIWNINFSFAFDGLSFSFILLSLFLYPIALLVGWDNIKLGVTKYLILLLILEFFLINIFCMFDLFFFFLFFESILIPMYFLIGVWGSRARKLHAANIFFLYTFIGSIPFFISIIYLTNILNTTDIFSLYLFGPQAPIYLQLFLWLSFFISFAVKVPLYPFHIWLPEAHVEASTVGSIILAGIMLKLGTYGIVRYLLPIFPLGTIFFRGIITTLCILGIIYISLITIRQIDLKKIIAYSSVAHMNFVVLGLFSGTNLGVAGSVYLMLSHGIVSSGLFLCVGILYDRYKNRLIQNYQGLVNLMPVFSIFLLILILSNISFPLTFGFVGEILIFIGIFNFSPVLAFLSCFGVIFGGVYSMWLYNRIIFGSTSKIYTYYIDLNKKETVCLLILNFLIFYFGIFPNILLKLIQDSFLIQI